MIRPSHPLATPNHAHAWLQSGLEAELFAQKMLGVEDPHQQALVGCALMAAATEVANPEITLWVQELESRGIPTVVSWTPMHCSVAVINPMGPRNGRCEIGPASRYLGYAEFVFDHKCLLRKVGYEFCYTQAPPKALDKSKETSSMEFFLRRAASELLIPGITEFRKAMTMAREREGQLRQLALRQVLERNAESAFALIAESGVPVPDDLQPALEVYKRLQSPAGEFTQTRKALTLKARVAEV